MDDMYESPTVSERSMHDCEPQEPDEDGYELEQAENSYENWITGE